MLTPRGECWVITDTATGNQRQALALAEYLAMSTRHQVLLPRAPWSWLAPRLALGGPRALPASQRALFAPPWPAAAIGCGRAAALFTRMLRRLSGGRCYTVQILDPRIDPAHWDTVVAPRHDALAGPNVLQPLGALNPIDDAWLARGRSAFPQFSALPQPRRGVLLGGPRHGIALDLDYATQLIVRLRQRQRRDGGSVLVLGSRRTPTALIEAFRPLLHDIPGLLWGRPEDGCNPYAGVLGWADELVVTPDSVNMLSEACAVGCPVLSFAPAALPAKIRHFHRSLLDAHLLHDMAAPPGGRQLPLRETAQIAATVAQRILAAQARARGE